MNDFQLKRLPGFLFQLLFLTMLASTPALYGQDKNWRPVTNEEIQMKTPKVEPDADAEAIFWDVRVDDSSSDDLSLSHYVRVKIFTEKGKESFSKKDIYFGKNTRIKDVQVRVTKPDGSVVSIEKEDILEREIAKANGVKIKAKSFAVPSLEIGSIVEYRYKEVIGNAQANMSLIFQREVPIEVISYFIRPFAGDRGMQYSSFNVGKTRFEKDKDGFYRATMTNVPAFREEAYMLPENNVKSWMYIYYVRETPKNADEYWSKLSKAYFESTKGWMKPNGDITEATNQAIAGAASDDEKLHRIFDYVKANIRNIAYAENASADERKKAANSRNATDTFKLKMADGDGVDNLFGAMARAAGFDARLALTGNRNELLFDPNVANAGIMLGSSNVAVKVGSEWRFFSPAAHYVPYGMLGWAEEGQTAMIPDPKELIWKLIPLTSSAVSSEKRSGKFKILDDGTLEGEGRIEFSGHLSVRQKSTYRKESASEREKSLKAIIAANVTSSVVVDDCKMENIDDPEKNVVFTFKLRAPGYAAKTGKRIFFQPNIFEHNSKPRFVSSSRKYDIYFSYPFSENDDIAIEFPAGYSLESPDVPAEISDPQKIGIHKIQMFVSADKKVLSYKRSFSFGNDGYIRFPVTAYQPIKGMFEAFNKADVHQLTLKQDAAATSK